jgi:hypothetical protein
MKTSILALAFVFGGFALGTALAEAAQPKNGPVVIQNFNNTQANDIADTDDVAGVNEDDNDDQGADNDDQGSDHDGDGAGSDDGDHDGQGGDNDGQGGDHDSQGGDGDSE